MIDQFKVLSSETLDRQSRTADAQAEARLKATEQLMAPVREGLERFDNRLTEVDPEQAEQTGRELSDLRAFVEDLYSREQGGERFEPEQAEVLGTEAQDRATAIAGQVSQAAAELGVTIEQ